MKGAYLPPLFFTTFWRFLRVLPADFEYVKTLRAFFPVNAWWQFAMYTPYATTDQVDIKIEHSLTAGSNIQSERERSQDNFKKKCETIFTFSILCTIPMSMHSLECLPNIL